MNSKKTKNCTVAFAQRSLALRTDEFLFIQLGLIDVIVISGHDNSEQVNVERPFYGKIRKFQNRLLFGLCGECSNWSSASVRVGHDVDLCVFLRRGVFWLES